MLTFLTLCILYLGSIFQALQILRGVTSQILSGIEQHTLPIAP